MTGAFGWSGIARLGLVQACMGAVVVLTTSTLNRIMVVELALPALLPGILVAFHYLIQVVRPRMGHGSDVGGRRTPWLIGGMGALAMGGVVSALAVVWMATQPVAGIALAVVGFGMIGLGVSACGTSLLVLLAKRVPAERRAAAATIVWMMMIVGFAVTAGTAGKLLDPYSPQRLLVITSAVSLMAIAITALALRGLEGAADAVPAGPASPAAASPGFRVALSQVWAEPTARRFTIFVFVSMLAYSSQDLILEPFAGSVFGYTPGESTQLSGVQHSGVLLGMVLVAVAGSGVLGRWMARLSGRAAEGVGPAASRSASLRAWTIGGCLASALALLGLVVAGLGNGAWPFRATVFLMGGANGAFSIAAIGSMMSLASQGRESREGVRMGLWGAAQAVAFGLGGLVGTGASDLARWWFGTPGVAYAAVFAFEAALFVLAAWLAWRAVGDAGMASAQPDASSEAPRRGATLISTPRLVARDPQAGDAPVVTIKSG
ncbi:MAG: BCD family MFS transporter [Burkholderiaceae bacterium]|nr:BCD family MFS transporter [Burkholderiaceae bacterium]